MKVIFQDAFLRYDVSDYVARAMIISMDDFKSNSWSIRNAALMNFTSLIRRLLDNFHIQT